MVGKKKYCENLASRFLLLEEETDCPSRAKDTRKSQKRRSEKEPPHPHLPKQAKPNTKASQTERKRRGGAWGQLVQGQSVRVSAGFPRAEAEGLSRESRPLHDLRGAGRCSECRAPTHPKNIWFDPHQKKKTVENHFTNRTLAVGFAPERWNFNSTLTLRRNVSISASIDFVEKKNLCSTAYLSLMY